jgi:hypothetical protein
MIGKRDPRYCNKISNFPEVFARKSGINIWRQCPENEFYCSQSIKKEQHEFF